MRSARTWGWRRMRRCDDPSNDLGPLWSHQSYPDCIIATRGYDFREGQVGMGKILVSLAFATALLALASSEASAFLYSSFVCQAVGARSVDWGRSFFIGEAKVIALSRCARRSGICTISYCVPGY